MTIGDIQDSLKRIAELEEQIKVIQDNREDYLYPDQKIDELEMLIGLERSKSVFGEDVV